MQFHGDGFRAGDPRVAPAATTPPETLPDEVDVLIVGAGPAGLTLAAYLSQFPEVRTALVERKEGPMALGQADGIACRTMEMFQVFGFAGAVAEEAYWVNEVVFWRPDAAGRIGRADRVQDVEDGLSEFPHVILNQARIHDYYLQAMERSPTRARPFYGWSFAGLERDADGVTVTLKGADGARTVRAAYVVGCDGARSGVRGAIGQALKGDSANSAWGVMDALVVTDFPDLRLKAAIQSAGDGNLMIIPREGGHLARFYIEMDKLAPGERVAARNIMLDDVTGAAARIFRPYAFDVKEVAWWSVYEIGQRLCDRFDDGDGGRAPRVFIAGDACHTHSPKAGQGMNVSMQDAFNLGWKLAQVLKGRAEAGLLATYPEERQAIAAELIAFDREWAAIFAAKGKGEEPDPEELQRYFVKSGRYTAGVEATYPPGRLTGDGAAQAMATGFPVGKRFHSAPAIRLADAKPVHLGHVVRPDARWRLFLFADAGDGLDRTCGVLDAHPDLDCGDGGIDVRGVLQTPHRETDFAALPPLLRPATGRFGLTDYERAFCPDPAADVFDLRGIDRARGAMVLVRPDQFVATVLPLGEVDALAAFMRTARGV